MKLRVLLSTTCFGSIALATPAFAQTTVTGESTTPLSTGTAGNVTIKNDAELIVATGAAVTVNSNNSVTVQEDDDDDTEDEPGQITAGGGNGATGILVQPGVTTTVSNAGVITVLEDYDPEDEDANGVADGAIASASDRFGIHVASGGTVSGTITNSGSITVEGLDSGGIVLDATLNGSLVQSGTIYVAGDNSVGIRTADVTGNIVLEGSTLVTGAGARALSVEGDVGGTIRIQGSVGHQLTFTYNDDGDTISLSRFDLRSGAAAVAIEGNVAGGIIVAVPPSDESTSDDDEDDDGVDDDEEGTGVVTSYGNGPAMLIGSDKDITIGTLSAASGGYSLLSEGTISGTASYSNTDAYGLVIGGAGGTVTMPGGIGVSGAVVATTYDSTATALLINQGATVGSLYNSGSISAQITSQGEGAAYAIRDLSGTLTTIENTGFISAVGSNTDIVRAIDLSGTTADVTITQHLNADDAETHAEAEEDGDDDTTVYTAISGHIETGSGNDTLDVSSGQILGNTYFNAGDDRLLLSGESYYAGKVYFGAGTGTALLSDTASFVGTMDFGSNAGTLTITDDAIFSGVIANGKRASVVVESGEFGVNGVSSFAVGSLTVKSGGVFRAYIDGENDTSSLVTADTATFESGSTVTATISSLEDAEGSYTILTAGTLTGTATFDDTDADIPFIFKGTLSTVDNSLILDIRRKAATELGLRSASASAYDAILTAAIEDDIVAQSFLDIDDAATLQTQVAQMLPDHAGGLFDAVTRSTRLVSQHVMDRDAMFDYTETGNMVVWGEPVAWRSNRKATGVNAYKTSGWGLSGGVEWLTGIGYVGGSFGWTGGKVTNNGGTSTIDTSQSDFGAFWRSAREVPLFGYARIGVSRISFSSERTVSLTASDTDYSYTSSADWGGWLFSGMGGVTYDLKAGPQFTIRPRLGLEWYQLRESSYDESGGGDAIDLYVDKRTSSALNGIGTLALSYAFAPPSDSKPLTIEFEGGRRQVLAGTLGATSAHFVDGDKFKITPDGLDDSWTGEFRVMGGGFDHSWKVAAGAEKTQNGSPNFSARASFSIAF